MFGYNVQADEWIPMAECLNAYSQMSAAVYKNQAYLLGGIDKQTIGLIARYTIWTTIGRNLLNIHYREVVSVLSALLIGTLYMYWEDRMEAII